MNREAVLREDGEGLKERKGRRQGIKSSVCDRRGDGGRGWGWSSARVGVMSSGGARSGVLGARVIFVIATVLIVFFVIVVVVQLLVVIVIVVQEVRAVVCGGNLGADTVLV